MAQRLIVVLSDEAPVTIHPLEWPQVAWGGNPQNGLIRVRRHYKDGRLLVYGAISTDRGPKKAGYMLDASDNLVDAIWTVHDEIGAAESVVKEVVMGLPPIAV